MANKKKNDFISVLKNGSDYQKGIIVANSNADTVMTGKGFLTDSQIRELMSTIRTDHGANIYNSIMDIEKNIRLAIFELESEFNFFESRFWMYQFFADRHSLSFEIPESLNAFLYEHPEQRDNLLKHLNIKHVNYFASKEEPFIEGQVRPELGETLIKVANALDSARVRVKTVSACIRDYMEEKDVILDAYSDKIQEIEEQVRNAYLPLEDEIYKAMKKKNPKLIQQLLYEDGVIKFLPYDELDLDKKYYKQFRRKSIEGVTYDE